MAITALLLAAVASYAIGAVWYGLLFRAPWRRLTGVSGEASRGEMARSMALGFVLDLVKAYVMLRIVASMGAYSVATGVEVGFWAWLGLAFTVLADQAVYARRSWVLTAIDGGYYLVSLMAIGGILAVW